LADSIVYTTVPGKLPELLKKIRESGVPAKANKAWLQSLGFKSSNDPSLLTVLRQIGFIDPSGSPTPAWKEYRGADAKGVLGRAIMLGYDSLYSTYPDAHERSTTDIGHVFSTKTDAGKQSIDKMVSTFKNLASIAEFSGGAPTTLSSSPIEPPSQSLPQAALATPVITANSPTGTGLNVNINIELTLPETTDEKVFEAFFKAMRKHLLDQDPT
jgi:hypothetical protein